ncbi:hypothetical protein D9611_013300 [Ephemerocybe angulata]|uniref:F-box domain-containing protein n=1 Tax=Ephemerocybe angulata TaxID=980116 RepID=A0A8H5CCA9_9AGAR|nr:hypothetical protein D9611_013300 [Tulosesus angulatus]
MDLKLPLRCQEKLAFLKNTYDFPSIEAADSFLADVKILSDVGEFHHYDSYSMAPLKASGSDFSTASPVSLTFFVQTHSAISEGDKKPGVTIRDVRPEATDIDLILAPQPQPLNPPHNLKPLKVFLPQLSSTSIKMVQEQATSLSELLHNNAPPNNLDLSIIKARSEAMAKRIAELQDELKNLEHQLHLHKCVFSPARRIPTEILTMIFDFASAEPPWFSYDDIWERDTKSLSTIPLVCKRWRDVAYDAGKLWAVQKVDIPKLTQKQCDSLLRWYCRSKGTPKTLAFKIPYEVKAKPCECYKETGGPYLCSNVVLQRILGEGAPFSRISIAHFTPTCFKNIVRYIKSTEGTNGITTTATSTSQHWWDKVHKLVLDFHYGSANENDPYWLQSQLPVHSIFTSFPDSLISLSLHLPNLEKQSHRKVLEIPPAVLRKLITFSLSYTWGGPQFLTALQHCINVEDLSLHLGDTGSANLGNQINVTSLSQDHIVLPKVKSLLLRIKGASAVVKHIGVLRFPGLVKLCIKSEYEYKNPQPYSNILQAIGLFSPTASQDFESLGVVGYINSDDLYNLLGSLTSPLTHLATDATFDPREFLKLALDAPTGTPNLLPSLQSLEVRHFPCKYHLDSLFLYIKSRQKHGKQKGKVVMKAPYDRLKWVMLKMGSSSDVKKAYDKESATLRMLRESFGIKVDRMEYHHYIDSKTSV